MFVTYSLLFLFGITFGSFLNVVGLRVPVGQSVIKPRSSCSNCDHSLTWIELIPLLSYLIQKGKCRNCKVKLSPMYLLIELLTGILFVITPLVIGWRGETFEALLLISLLIIITVSDLEYKLIPNKVLSFFAIVFIIEAFLLPTHSWTDRILGTMIGFVLLTLIAILSRGKMGGGDIKLFTLLGFVLGIKLVMLTLFLSCLFGTIFGLIGLIFGLQKSGQMIPFGPYIFIGSLISYAYGEKLLNWYLNYFL